MERNPKLIILNSPTVGVDVGSKRDIHELLVGLRANGTAVLVVTDDIGEALAISDRILVMAGGRITATGARGDDVWRYVPRGSGKADPAVDRALGLG